MYELPPVPPSPRCEPLLVSWYFDFSGVCVPGTTCGTHTSQFRLLNELEKLEVEWCTQGTPWYWCTGVHPGTPRVLT